MTRTLIRLADLLAARRARRRAIVELRRFDDAQLADLGIRREEIPAYVAGRLAGRGPARRRRPRAVPAGGNVIRLLPAGAACG